MLLTKALEDGVLPLTLNGTFPPRIFLPSVGQSSLPIQSPMHPSLKVNYTSMSLNSLPYSSTPGCLSAFSSLGVFLPGDGFSSSSLTTLAPLARCHTHTTLAGTEYKTLHVIILPTFSVVTNHIPGINNVATNALSCPTQFPTWSSADLVSPELNPQTAYQINAEILLRLL